MNTVFISYSKKDAKYRDELALWLKPLEKEGLCKIFIDTRINTGEEWDPVIESAIDKTQVAILIITKHFIGSDYIYSKEMPRFLAKEKRGELKIYPIFYGISSIEQVPYFAHDDEAQSKKIILTKYQGIARPNEPMATLSKNKQNQALQKLMELLREELERLKHLPSSSKYQTILPSFQYLSIHLNIDDSQLKRSLKTDNGQKISESTDNWQDIEQELQSLTNWQHANHQRRPDQIAQAWGKVLYRILFGKQQMAEHLFSILNEGHNSTPLHKGHKLYINTFEESLRVLPWQLTTWQHYFLMEHNWRFTLNTLNYSGKQHLSSVKRQQLSPSAHSLIIASNTDSGKQAKALFQAVLQEKLYQKSQARIHIVTTKADLAQIISNKNIQLLIYYGDFELSAPNIDVYKCVHFIRRQKQLLWSSIILQEHFDSQAVELSYFIDAGLHHLSIESLYTESIEDSHTLKILAQWLSEEKHLLQSKYDYIDDHLRYCPRAQTLLLASSPNEIQHTIKIRTSDPQEVRLKFDRFALKTVLLGKLLILRNRPDWQTLMIIQGGYGSDQLHALNDQLQHAIIKEFSGMILLLPIELKIPDDRSNLRFNLEQDFKEQFEYFCQENQRELKLRQSQKRILIWINWGVYGHGIEEHPSLTVQELQDTLEFIRDHVPTHFPCNITKPPLLLNLISLDLTIKTHQEAEQHILSLRNQAEYAGLHFLDPQNLRNIKADDVQTFFHDYSTDLVSSHKPTRNKIAHIIPRQANGDFTQAVQLLEELAVIGERAFLGKYEKN